LISSAESSTSSHTRAEEQLRSLETAIEQSNESVMIMTARLDPPGPQILYVNPAFTKMTGYSPEEVIGKTPHILQGPKTDRAVLDQLRKDCAAGKVFHGETINYRKDGSEFHPEWIRVVAQDQADDRPGLGAMQELTPSDSPVHFTAPLPAGLTEDSSELFGFFTYELRVGHKSEWTTAQGRYGPPLRVTGVQHPAPALSCAVVRNSPGIIVSAPFAVPVFDGRSVQADKPRSQIWVLLYAQAERVDGQERRNVLLGRKPAPWTGFYGGGRTNEFGTATFGCSFSDQMPKFFISFAEVDQLGV
jgi:PAS domain S-box-containing protein